MTMHKVTLVIADNPLRGQPGQTDYTVTATSEPPWELPKGGGLPDPAGLSAAQAASVMVLAELAGLSYEAAIIQLGRQG